MGTTFLVLFVYFAAIVTFVFAQMYRDRTLSYIHDTDPGKLRIEFWTKLISAGSLPLIGLLAALFPEFTGYLTSWLQPGVEMIK